MSDLSIELHWQRAEAALATRQVLDRAYGAATTTATRFRSTPPLIGADDPENTNPEQALASALSSCHMMTFLALAAKAGWPVASYHDYAEAHLGKNAERPDVGHAHRPASGGALRHRLSTSTMAHLAQMQDRAHRYCFIANTLADSVEINIL